MFQQEALIDEMGKLRKFAQRLTKNTHNAEDLLQSTIVRALEKKEQFQNGTNLFSWTSKMMFNLFVSNHRQKKRFETQYDPEPYIGRMLVGPSQEAHVDLVTVRECMKRLSPEHREVLLLVSVHGMSYEEIATKLKLPGGTVRSRLSRARNHLQVLLNPVPCQMPANLCSIAAVQSRIAA
ncbi:MAG: sigma-70 family RNA polymerase sigma factor [Pseudomonadota bacterium]